MLHTSLQINNDCRTSDAIDFVVSETKNNVKKFANLPQCLNDVESRLLKMVEGWFITFVN